MERYNVMFVASAGGHLTELLKLSSLFINYNYVLVTERNKISLDLRKKFKVEFLLYGSRHYPVRYFIVSCFNFFKNIYLFFKYKPDLIYTTGAHTCVMLCYLAKLFGKKVIFVEVYDRVLTPTLSGKLVYPIADCFIVQHPELLIEFPKAKYIGGIY